MFNFQRILKQAWLITKTNRFLWIFGLFLILNSLFNYLGSFPGFDTGAIPSTVKGYGAAAVFLLGLLLIIISYRAQAAMIIAVKAILDKQQTDFRKSFQMSKYFYGRVLLVSLLALLAVAAIGFVLSRPVGHFATSGQLAQAWFLGAFALMIFIPVFVTSLLITTLAPLFIVIFDLPSSESVDKSFNLIKRFLLQLVVFAFILFVIGFLPFVLLSVLTYYIHGLAIWIIGLILVCILGPILITFQNCAWVLLFLELVRPQKFEQEETVPAPEIVG